MKLFKWIRKSIRKGVLVLCATIALVPATTEASQHKDQTNRQNFLSVVNTYLTDTGIQLTGSKSDKSEWSIRRKIAQASGLKKWKKYRGTYKQNCTLLRLWKKNGFPIYDHKSGSFVKAADTVATVASPRVQPSVSVPETVSSLPLEYQDDQNTMATFGGLKPTSSDLFLGDLYGSQTEENSAIKVNVATSTNVEPEKKTPEKVVAPTATPVPSPIHTRVHTSSSNETNLSGYDVWFVWIVGCAGTALIVFLFFSAKKTVGVSKEKEHSHPPPAVKIAAPAAVSAAETVVPKTPTVLPIIKRVTATVKPRAAEPQKVVTAITITQSNPITKQPKKSWEIVRDERKKMTRLNQLRGDITLEQIAGACDTISDFNYALSICDSVRTDSGTQEKTLYVEVGKEAKLEVEKIKNILKDYSLRNDVFDGFRAKIARVELGFRLLLWKLLGNELGLDLTPFMEQTSEQITS